MILLELARELSHFCKMARRSEVVGPRWFKYKHNFYERNY